MSKKSFIAMMVGVALLVPTIVMATPIDHTPKNYQAHLAVLAGDIAEDQMIVAESLFEGQAACYTGDEMIRFGNSIQTSEDWLDTGIGYFGKAEDLLNSGNFEGAWRLFNRSNAIFRMLQMNGH